MVDIDWMAPIGTVEVLLHCVPGLTANQVAQWQVRDKISRRGAGRGRATVWHAHDALEVACVSEVGRLSILPEHAAEFWAAARGIMLARQYPAPNQPHDEAVILCREQNGRLVFRLFYESAGSNHPTQGSGLNRPDAPRLFVMFRLGRFVDDLAERIAAVAPHVVRRAAA
jgi:hypothetical protein